ncbi:Putative aspartic protease [Glycine soja]|nr:Putative aspartic protease [Glycine soja]
MATPLVYRLVSLPFIFHFTLTTATIITSSINPVFLIHYESTLSLYNSKDTTWDHYSHKMLKQTSSNEYISNLVPSPRNVVFLINFSIGEPPVPSLAVMDTGSSFTWVMCHPCSSCSQQSVPIFDLSKSSTYALTFSECNKCDVVNCECPCSVEYVGSGSSKGIYAREQLTSETIDENAFKVPSLIFGCGREFSTSSNGYPYQGINGVFGLGSGRFSLLPSFGVLVLAQQDKHNPYTLCYSGVTTENEFCMAVLPGDYFGDDYESFSPIGMLAQQNYNVGYDLNGMRVYFQRFDCELLDG